MYRKFSTFLILLLLFSIVFVGIKLLVKAELPSNPNVERVDCVYLNEDDREKIYACYENWDNAKNKVQELNGRLEGTTKCSVYDSAYDSETLLINSEKSYLYCDDQGGSGNCDSAELQGEILFRKYCIGNDYVDDYSGQWGNIIVYETYEPQTIDSLIYPDNPNQKLYDDPDTLYRFKYNYDEYGGGFDPDKNVTKFELWITEGLDSRMVFSTDNKASFEAKKVHLDFLGENEKAAIYAWISYVPNDGSNELKRFSTKRDEYYVYREEQVEEETSVGKPPASTDNQFGVLSLFRNTGSGLKEVSSGEEISGTLDYIVQLSIPEAGGFTNDSIRKLELWIREGSSYRVLFSSLDEVAFQERMRKLQLSSEYDEVDLYTWVYYDSTTGERKSFSTIPTTFRVDTSSIPQLQAPGGGDQIVGGTVDDNIQSGEGGEIVAAESVLGIKCISTYGGDVGSLIYCILGKISVFLFWIVMVLTVIMAIVSGFLFIIAGGVPDKITQAKNALIATVVGAVIALSAWAIVTFVGGVLGLQAPTESSIELEAGELESEAPSIPEEIEENIEETQVDIPLPSIESQPPGEEESAPDTVA